MGVRQDEVTRLSELVHNSYLMHPLQYYHSLVHCNYGGAVWHDQVVRLMADYRYVL